MKKWSNGAKKRLVEIQADESAAADMRAMAEAISKLPPGQLKKVLTEEVLAVLEKYGVTV